MEATPSNELPILRPTDKQLQFATNLGIACRQDISRREISDLIEGALAKQEEERYERLDRLAERESEVREQLRAEIRDEIDQNDPRLSRATKKEILATFERAGEAAILITFNPDEIQDLEDLVGVEFAASKSDNIDVETMKTIIRWAGVAMMRL